MFPLAQLSQDSTFTYSQKFQARQDVTFGRADAPNTENKHHHPHHEHHPRRDASPSTVFIRSERYEAYQSSLSISTQNSASMQGASEADKVKAPSEGAVQASSNILKFIEAQLLRDLEDGATTEELESRLAAGLEGFQKGFAEAAQQLDEMGLLSDEMSAEIGDTKTLVMAGIDDLKSRFIGETGNASEESGEAAAAPQQEAPLGSLSSASAYERYDNAQKNSFQFSLTTADGDKVSIDASSMRASVTQQYASYIPGVETLLQYSEAQSENHQFSFSVDGELDEGELAAINDLLNQMNDLADTFFSGDLEGAFEQALEVGYDSSEISAFALNLSQTSVQRVTQAYEGVQGDHQDSPQTQAPALAERLQPLGSFVRDVLEALESASTFQQPGELIQNLTEWFDRSEDRAFQNTIQHILDGVGDREDD